MRKGSRPDHLLLDADVAPALVQLGVDLTRQDSDHFPLNLSVQCVPPTDLPAPDNGHPLPLLSWDMRQPPGCDYNC